MMKLCDEIFDERLLFDLAHKMLFLSHCKIMPR